MARKKLKSTLKSSSTKLPKSRITKDPEEKPRKIREKKQDDKPLHKKRLPAKPDDKLTILDPEYQRIKRKQAAKKAVETRKENEAAMPPEVLKQKRAEAARKAKETRRNKEAALPQKDREELRQKRAEAARKAKETRRNKEAALPQKEREELRQKRAEQARKNFTKKKEETSQEWFDSELDYASYTDEVLRQIEEFLEDLEFNEKYLGEYPSDIWTETYQRKAEFCTRIRAILDYRISTEGRDNVAKSIGESGVDVYTAINGIRRASTPEDVTYYALELITAIIGRPMSQEEGEIYNNIAESNTSYEMGDDEGEY